MLVLDPPLECNNCINPKYHIRSDYRTYPYKRTVKKFRSLQITANVLFLYFFIKAYVVGTHLNCILSILYKENQKKNRIIIIK